MGFYLPNLSSAGCSRARKRRAGPPVHPRTRDSAPPVRPDLYRRPQTVPRLFVRAQRHLVAGHGRLPRRLWSGPPGAAHVSHAGAEAAANIATGPRWSRLFGGPVRMHCPTRVKNDGNVWGTRITNTGLHDMGGILCSRRKSLNKRGPAAVPGSPDHNGAPLGTVVVLNQVGIIIAPGATRGKTSQIVCISSRDAPVTQQRRPLLSRKRRGGQRSCALT